MKTILFQASEYRMRAAPDGKLDYSIGLGGRLRFDGFERSRRVRYNLQKLTDKRVRHRLFSMI
jgi:hypothetical protein